MIAIAYLYHARPQHRSLINGIPWFSDARE